MKRAAAPMSWSLARIVRMLRSRRWAARGVGVVRPGARPHFDGSTSLTAAERAEYRCHSRVFGMLDDRRAEPDEGPEQPIAGTAVGEQRRADLVPDGEPWAALDRVTLTNDAERRGPSGFERYMADKYFEDRD